MEVKKKLLDIVREKLELSIIVSLLRELIFIGVKDIYYFIIKDILKIWEKLKLNSF